MLVQLQNLLRYYWPKFNWGLFHLLSSAKLMTLTLLVITAALFLASGSRYRRRTVTANLGVLAAYWFMISPLHYLITDQPYMLRAWLTLKSLGFSVTPHIEPIPDWVASHERSFLAIRAYLGLISYAALGRFESRPASELPQVAQAALTDFPRDRCLMTTDQFRQSLPSS